jgi:hypothetical protein
MRSIDELPPSGGTLPAALEGSIKLILSVVATQRQPDPGEDGLIIPGQIVEVPEYTSISRNPKLAFAQHSKNS